MRTENVLQGCAATVLGVAIAIGLIAALLTYLGGYARLKEAPSISRASFRWMAGSEQCARKAYFAIDNRYVFAIRKRGCPGPADLALYGRTSRDLSCSATSDGNIQTPCRDEMARAIFDKILRTFEQYKDQGYLVYGAQEGNLGLAEPHRVINLFEVHTFF